MLFRVDAASTQSLADQIAVQVRAGVVDGSLAPGERLPPARDLATALQVNMHTVLRAYKQLRDEGIIEMRQGRGAFVRQDAGPGLVRITELAEQLLEEARKLGMSQQDLARLIGGVAQA
ncbi:MULTISPECIES: GntR family transcriptional regulator [Arthrobacter]|uniref:GntR family transcriptional regulator n=1 Tax=Arthrobacter TaxID=1663 RepID=UPI0005363468|nr:MULTISPECIES: GntR family transcriptional regulator [Arthrobacter]AIY03934.1 Transcriptional regulator, GntR family [Arthrobacter sp. PAMC 25486]